MSVSFSAGPVLARLFATALVTFSLALYMGTKLVPASQNLTEQVRQAVSDPACLHPALSEPEKQELAAFYSARGFSAIWSDSTGLKEDADVLLAELLRSSVHGLRPEFYDYHRLTEMKSASTEEIGGCFEVLMSNALVLYANDLANGHIRSSVHPEHTVVTPVTYSPQVLLDKVVAGAGLQDFLASLLTTDDRYVRLISKLAEFLRIEKLDAWPEVRNLGSSDNPELDFDKLRQLLLFTGDLNPSDLDAAADTSTRAFRLAVARFQNRHGLEVSQRVDKPTYQEMAMPLGRRIDLIRINLERRRWQNRDLGPDHVYINIADRSVRFVRGGKKSGSAHFRTDPGFAALPTFTGRVVALSKDSSGSLVLHIKPDVVTNSAGGRSEVSFALEDDADKNLRYLLGAQYKGLNEIADGERVPVDATINGFVTYLTVWANKDGSINFRPDRLRRDGELAGLLGFSAR